jgi:D-inositol-3-phosphate glycosyltransferase
MKIVIVGTAYPLRGGIAHYVALLAETLVRRGHEVRIITFKRQYPKILFPGKSQEEAPSANSQSATLPSPGPSPRGGEKNSVTIPTDIIIDTVNPLTWMKAGALAAKYEPDMIIFKYWLPFFAPAYGVIARTAKRQLRKKKKQTKVVFIADNVIPHEKRPGDLALTKFAFKSVDHFIVQSEAVERDLKSVAPNASFVRLDHPVYEIFGQRVDRNEARKELGLPNDAPAILFFGYIRKYKGLDILLRAMPRMLQSLPELRLIVAGEYYSNEAEHLALIKKLQIPEKNLILATDYIPNGEVGKYFSAANVCVLPYRSATQSGIVQIAYNFNTPVIATDVGGLAEIVIDGKSGSIVEEATPEAVAEKVIEFFTQKKEAVLTQGVIEEKKKYSWDTFAEGIEKLNGN